MSAEQQPTAFSPEMLAEFLRLKAENEALKAQVKPKSTAQTKQLEVGDNLRVAVSEKGAISIYGLNRMPVTLYIHQLRRVAGAIPKIMAWTELPEVKSRLTQKPIKAE